MINTSIWNPFITDSFFEIRNVDLVVYEVKWIVDDYRCKGLLELAIHSIDSVLLFMCLLALFAHAIALNF